MALSTPRTIFGIHSASAYSVSTGLPYGMLQVLQGSEFSLSGDQIPLNGGSFRYPWAIEDGNITAELSIVTNEYPDFLYEIALGKAPTANAAEATGNVSTLTNKNGTSAVDATTGIATVTATAADEADLKFTKYAVVVLSGGVTVDVYAYSNVDFQRGTDTIFENDGLKINAAPITIVDAGATVAIADYGLTLTSGSGTIAMTEGDTATFEVRPINSASSIVTVGATSDIFPEIGLNIQAQQSSSGRMFEIDVFRAKILGLPHSFNTKAFSEATITGQAYYDSNRSGVFSMRDVTPV